MIEPPWLAIARTKIGTKEMPGPGNNPTIMQWAKDARDWLGVAYSADSVPWCGLFVSKCVAQAGFKAPRRFIGVRASQWATWGDEIPLTTPRPPIGTIAVLQRPGGGHVFILSGVTVDGRLVGVGGNQQDMVTEASFSRGRLVALRWPPGVARAAPAPVLRGPFGLSTREA